MNVAIIIGSSILLAVVPFSSAATIYLTAADGKDSMTLDAGASGEMQIRLNTILSDTIKIAFVNAFLDTGSNTDDLAILDVTGVSPGNAAPWVYDRSYFAPLPTELEFPQGDEYGLVSGDATPTSGGYPLGAATHIHDTLILTNVAGTLGDYVDVTFELGTRQPQAFGPGPTFIPFGLASQNFPPNGYPNYLFVGDSQSNNTPFRISFIPEPSSLGLLAVSIWPIIGLRRRSRQSRHHVT